MGAAAEAVPGRGVNPARKTHLAMDVRRSRPHHNGVRADRPLLPRRRTTRLHVTIARRSLLSQSDRPASSREKVRAYRERLRRQGLRPIQIWVPDVRSPNFKAEAHRQSLAVAESGHAAEDQGFIDAISELDDT
jgi:hypothetical protein